MKNFDERKAEIICRAQKQKEKEKKARNRAWGIGVVTAFCLCITVGVVLHTPNLQEDMITDAESKGNALDQAGGDYDANASKPTPMAPAVDEDGIRSEEPPAEDEKNEAADEESSVSCETGEWSEEDIYEVFPEDSIGEDVTSNPVYEQSLPHDTGVSNSAVFDCLGVTVALVHVEEVYRDDWYDDFGEVLLAKCRVLFIATDGEEKENLKLVLPLSYMDKVEDGDTLVVALDKNDVHDTLLRDDTVCILGKSEEVFTELTPLGDFATDMTEDEALTFFEEFLG